MVRDWGVQDLRGAKGYKGSGKDYDKGGDYAGHDNFPEWYFRPSKKEGNKITPLSREDYETAKQDFYELCGWDKDPGAPTRHTLKKYDLGDVAEILDRRGLLPPEKTV